MYTRSEHMSHAGDDRQSHRRYYSQFVTPAVIAQVAACIGADKLRASRDPHFNDIPLHRWDILAQNLGPLGASFQALGDYATLGGLVCVAKEAARQFVEGAR